MSPSTPSATASRPLRWPASSRCSCWRSRSAAPRAGRRRLRANGRFDRERTSVDLRRGGGHRPLQRPTASGPLLPSYARAAARRARRASAPADRGLLPRRAEQRDRRPDRQPARPRRGELHRRRRLRLQSLPRSTWPARSSPRAPATWCCAAAPTPTTASTTSRCSPRCTPCRPAGACATFDAEADGIALGEGVGLRGAQAPRRRRARRRPHLRGDQGRGRVQRRARSLGLTAPRPEGQRRALDRAYAMAGISPAAVGHDRGARHRHRGRRPHRAGHADRDVHRERAPSRPAARSAR